MGIKDLVMASIKRALSAATVAISLLLTACDDSGHPDLNAAIDKISEAEEAMGAVISDAQAGRIMAPGEIMAVKTKWGPIAKSNTKLAIKIIKNDSKSGNGEVLAQQEERFYEVSARINLYSRELENLHRKAMQ